VNDDTSNARFDRSLARFEALQAAEPADTMPQCRSALLHHGVRTERVYVLFHGFTNCPAQYERLRADLHASGATVLCPLAPGHGRADRSPTRLTALSAEGLAAWITDVVGIAEGLGRAVCAVGFSFGGVCAAWAGHRLDAVSEVALVAPSFLPRAVPRFAGPLLPLYMQTRPERYLWWDPLRRERMLAAPHIYKQLSSRGISAVFELGQQVSRTSSDHRTAPLHRATLVLNEFDFAISHGAARAAFEAGLAPFALDTQFVRVAWRRHWPHDFIDPLGKIGDREPEGRQLLLSVIDASFS
jgi:carboxylesterase